MHFATNDELYVLCMLCIHLLEMGEMVLGWENGELKDHKCSSKFPVLSRFVDFIQALNGITKSNSKFGAGRYSDCKGWQTGANILSESPPFRLDLQKSVWNDPQFRKFDDNFCSSCFSIPPLIFISEYVIRVWYRQEGLALCATVLH